MVEEGFLNIIEQQKIEYDRDSDPVEGDKSTAVFQAALMTYQATKHLAKHVPSRQDIHLGDIVIFIKSVCCF